MRKGDKMTKEKPEQFDEFMGICRDYYLYWIWDYFKENGTLYRTKIENATKKKICEKCGQEIK